MPGRLGKLAIAVASAVALCSPGALASSSSPPASELAPIHGPYSPSIDPANFVARIDNRYLPLEPGTAFHFEGVRGKTPQTDDEVVPRTQADHRRQVHGRPGHGLRARPGRSSGPSTGMRRTSRATSGTWARTRSSCSHGRFVKASDSWESGVNGAKPGIIMPAHPRPGDAYRQEYYPPGQALDQARVLGRPGKRDGAVRHLQAAAGHQRAQPAGAADRAEVLRARHRRGRGAGGQGAPRGLRARQRDPLRSAQAGTATPSIRQLPASASTTANMCRSIVALGAE